jgi:hypothetical protein
MTPIAAIALGIVVVAVIILMFVFFGVQGGSIALVFTGLAGLAGYFICAGVPGWGGTKGGGVTGGGHKKGPRAPARRVRRRRGGVEGEEDEGEWAGHDDEYHLEGMTETEATEVAPEPAFEADSFETLGPTDYGEEGPGDFAGEAAGVGMNGNGFGDSLGNGNGNGNGNGTGFGDSLGAGNGGF